ncbi:MAG TPA: MFS transporter [Solirubrobacteraceae bacterium]|jgi:MFS family permease|nr:MFS transporter [Solirubrobacteraceae bacterium]
MHTKHNSIFRVFSMRPVEWSGPLAGNYWGAVAMVICALTPFLVLSAATNPLQSMIGHSVGLGNAGMEMSAGMADAAYCFGTILAVQLTSRLPGRRLLLLYAAVFTVATILTASTSSPAVFFVGRIFEGLTTSLMLITAAPALVLGFPVARMRSTAMVMNMGIFGAVAVGPVIGGAFVSLADWRLLFWIAAGVGAVAVVLGLLTFADQPPADSDLEYDFESLGLASIGCTAAFFGVSNLTGHAFVSAIVLVPLLLGISCLVGLIVHQSFVKDPLMPIRQLGHTVPIAAIALAMFAGAGSIALVGLVQLTVLTHHISSAVFWPEFGGAVLTAFLFGRLFFTKYTPLLAFAGLLGLAGTGFLITGTSNGDTALIAIGTGGLGLGVGASVAPGLFVAGFAMPALQLQRIFALVELLRGVAAFLTAPLLIHLAETTGTSLDDGVGHAIWASSGLLVIGALVVSAIVAAGGLHLSNPRFAEWQAGEGTAIESTPLFAAIRKERVPVSV